MARLLHSLQVFSDGDIQVVPPRKLCFVLWDHQLAQYNYRPRNLVTPVPETCPLYSGDRNIITPAWFAYIWDLLRLCNPRMAPATFQKAWAGFWVTGRAFTDGSDPNSGNFRIHSLTCGGATHELVSGDAVMLGGVLQYEIYTMSSLEPPPPVPTRADQINMTLHFFATSGSNVKLPDGSYAVNGFPQFDNPIVPLLSRMGVDFIAADRVKLVDAIQRPYNP